jgi:hypothetical protein
MDNDYVTKTDLQFALDGAVQTIITEMGIRFGEVNQRLDRIDTPWSSTESNSRPEHGPSPASTNGWEKLTPTTRVYSRN